MMKHATASQSKRPTNWRFVSDFCSDFQFKNFVFELYSGSNVYDLKSYFPTLTVGYLNLKGIGFILKGELDLDIKLGR